LPLLSKSRPILGILLACWLCPAQVPLRNPSPRDLAEGKRLYLNNCAPCHGTTGDGGKGADLTRPRLPRASDDRSFFNVIRFGIPGTEMPNTRQFSDRDIWQVIAYVRTFSRHARHTTGDVRRGAALYQTKGGCPKCHMVRGQGGRLGPDLSDVGLRRSPGYLRSAILNPESGVLDNFFLYRTAAPLIPDSFLQVRVATKDGRRITGIRLNEDPFTIQIRDFSDRFYSFEKTELVELQKDWGKSPMPRYQNVFTAAELDDLVAYLASLQGAP
jgi:cytochrome c oxidase cbb3-type subunit 3